jgi:hypothetical protein
MAYQQYSPVYNAQQTATLPPFAVSPFMNSFAFCMFSVVASAMTVGANVAVSSSSSLSLHRNGHNLGSLKLRSISVALQSHTWTHKHSSQCITELKIGPKHVAVNRIVWFVLTLLNKECICWLYRLSIFKKGNVNICFRGPERAGTMTSLELGCPVFDFRESKDLFHNVHTASYSVSTGLNGQSVQLATYLELTFGSRVGVCK